MSKTNKRTILLVAWLALLGVVFFAINRLSSIVRPGGVETEPAPQFSVADLQRRWPEIVANAAGPLRGDPRARYTLVEFGDFQCPQCGKARPVIESLLRQAPKQVNLLFFHRPFPSFHKFALDSAEASEVAAAHGKFWPMYDTLYSHQDDLEPGYYGDYAAGVGLDRRAFQTALDTHQYKVKVAEAAKLADSLKIQLTPTLLLRDNTTGKITPYVGMDSSVPGAAAGFLGIKQFAANPPWNIAPKTAQK